MTTFAYPGYNPTVFITLRDPEKNDPERDLSEVYIHGTKGGQYKSNISASCFNEYERILTFTALCAEEKESFLAFVLDSFGHYIKYTDYNGVNWMTQITNDNVDLEESPTGWTIVLTLLVWEA
jgi:hypothetical protein